MRRARGWVVAVVSVSGLLGPGLSIAQEAARTGGDKYALVVGVRTYDPNELHNLPYSETDATGLARVFRENGYRPDNVVLLTQSTGADDPRFTPTAERIRAELKLLLDGRDPADSVVVALAGHGIQFQGETESY